MDTFLTSIVTGEYEEMASALIEMGATDKDVDSKSFAVDLEKIFSSIQVSVESRIFLCPFCVFSCQLPASILYIKTCFRTFL